MGFYSCVKPPFTRELHSPIGVRTALQSCVHFVLTKKTSSNIHFANAANIAVTYCMFRKRRVLFFQMLMIEFLGPPVITTAPENQTVQRGDAVNFTCAAIGKNIRIR